MQKFLWLLAFGAAVLLCGCNQQTQRNTEKIDVLTQKMFVLQQAQTKQLEAIQKELASLPPLTESLTKKYYQENQAKALFFHTNTLYFLVAIDKRIQQELEQADTARQASDQLAYFYHTNQNDTTYFCASQVTDAIDAQEKRLEQNVGDTVRQVNSALNKQLSKQIQSLAPDKAQIQAIATKQAAIETKLTQIERELSQIKTLLQQVQKTQQVQKARKTQKTQQPQQIQQIQRSVPTTTSNTPSTRA